MEGTVYADEIAHLVELLKDADKLANGAMDRFTRTAVYLHLKGIRAEVTREWRVVLVTTDGRVSASPWTTEAEAYAAHDINQKWFAEKDPKWLAAYSKSQLETRQISESVVVEEAP